MWDCTQQWWPRQQLLGCTAFHFHCRASAWEETLSPYLNNKLGKCKSEQDPRGPALANDTSFSLNPANKPFCSVSSMIHNNEREKTDQIFAMPLRAQLQMKEAARKHLDFLWFAPNQTMKSITLHKHCLVPSWSTCHSCSMAFLRILHEKRANPWIESI